MGQGNEEKLMRGHNAEEKPVAAPLVLFLKLLLTPVEGWKAMKRAAYHPDEVEHKCFFPLIGCAAVAQFMELWNNPLATMSHVLVQALVVFVSLFFSYFCVVRVLSWVSGEEVRERLRKPFTKVFLLMALSSLTLFYTIISLLPMLQEILIFLPVYTLYLVARGVKYLRLPKEKESVTLFWIEALVIGMPVGLYFLLDYLIPAI